MPSKSKMTLNLKKMLVFALRENQIGGEKNFLEHDRVQTCLPI